MSHYKFIPWMCKLNGVCESSIRDFNGFDEKHNTKYKLATIFAVTHIE